MKVYLIPGLGYDCRIFSRLDLGAIKTECIPWIEPEKGEPISDYAQRLFAQVADDEQLILIGHSMGAIVAQEIAKVKKVDKIILLSSIKSREELPFFFKLVRPFGIHKFFTKELSNWSIKYWGSAHGFAKAEDQDLFKSMVGKQSNHYLQWALRSLSTWQSPQVPASTELLQIHGTADKTFPIQKVRQAEVIVEGGSHIMVYHQAEKISRIIKEAIG